MVGVYPKMGSDTIDEYQGEAHLKQAFPDAYLACQVIECASGFMRKHGFKQEKTRLLHSTCPDEINRLLDSESSPWGPPFHMGGLAGMPFAGQTGFAALASHVPDDGMIFMVYGPHVGQDNNGQFGSVPRVGMHACTTACGAAIGAFRALSNASTKDNRDDLVNKLLSNDADMQQALLTKCVNKCYDDICTSEEPMCELVNQLYSKIHKRIHDDIIPTNCKSPIAFLGGIQVNTPPGTKDYFAVKNFFIRHPKESKSEVDIDLTSELKQLLNNVDASTANSAL